MRNYFYGFFQNELAVIFVDKHGDRFIYFIDFILILSLLNPGQKPHKSGELEYVVK